MSVEKGKMSKKKKIWLSVGIAAAVVIVAAGIVLGFVLKGMSDYDKAVADIVIEDIDFTELSDGTYKGSYNVGGFPAYINVDVEVTVSSNKVTKIEVTKYDNGSGGTAEEKKELSKKITDVVVEKQSLKGFGYTTGATNGQKTILKAIEKALKAGPVTE